MKPIINPIWFYLIGIIEDVDFFLEFWGIIMTIAGAVAIIVPFVTIASNEHEEKLLKSLKKFTKLFYIGLLCVILGVLTPKQEACYQIMAASVVTPDNIEIVGDKTTDVIDYIVDSVDQLLEKGSK